MSTSRRNLSESLRTLWLEVRDGVYYVRRGHIEWPGWRFDVQERAVAIKIPNETMFPIQAEKGAHRARVRFEVFSRLDEDPDREVNEKLMDEIRQDVREVVNRLLALREGNAPVVFRVFKETASLIEDYNSEAWIQGVVAEFDVAY